MDRIFLVINHKRPTKSGRAIICFIKTFGLFKQLESIFFSNRIQFTNKNVKLYAAI